MGGISERGKEIKRRRKRRSTYKHFAGKLKKATTSEKGIIVAKLRNMSPGAEVVIENWGLQESNR